MVVVNYSDELEEDKRELIPNGWYLVRVETVNKKETKNSDEMWNLKLRIEDGNYIKWVIFDNLVFSDNEYCRRKNKGFLKRLGFDVSKELIIVPDEIINALIYVFVESEDAYNNPEIKRNCVRFFQGYASIEEYEKKNERSFDLEGTNRQKNHNMGSDKDINNYIKGSDGEEIEDNALF